MVLTMTIVRFVKQNVFFVWITRLGLWEWFPHNSATNEVGSSQEHHACQGDKCEHNYGGGWTRLTGQRFSSCRHRTNSCWTCEQLSLWKAINLRLELTSDRSNRQRIPLKLTVAKVFIATTEQRVWPFLVISFPKALLHTLFFAHTLFVVQKAALECYDFFVHIIIFLPDCVASMLFAWLITITRYRSPGLFTRAIFSRCTFRRVVIFTLQWRNLWNCTCNSIKHSQHFKPMND